MRKIALVILAGCLVLSMLSLTFVVPARAGDDSTPCPSSPAPGSTAVGSTTPDGTAVGSPTPSGTPASNSDDDDIVSYVGILSKNADGEIILTTVDGDEIVVAPSGAFAPGQIDMTLTYEITGTETEDGTLKAISLKIVIAIATATPTATATATATATGTLTATATTTAPTATATTPTTTGDDCNHKVQICHHPGGDVNKARTLSIDKHALPAHLAHGDTVGPCPPKQGNSGSTGKPGNGNSGNGNSGGKGNGKPGGKGNGKP